VVIDRRVGGRVEDGGAGIGRLGAGDTVAHLEIEVAR
jgi:hypothetical protein